MIDSNKINSGLWSYDLQKSKHFKVICEFLNYLNSVSKEFILKRGTSLMVCYGLNRFSEDIDLDSTNKNIKPIVDKFCQNYGYTYRVAEDTPTTKRFMIHYDDKHKPLKLEISYRQKHINENNYTFINGVVVYNIENLFRMKLNAYNQRDKIRDLYDVVFILKHYRYSLSDIDLEIAKDVLSYKGLEQFDYLIHTQKDELIDTNQLACDFLEVFNDLEILDDYQLDDHTEEIDR